MKYFAITAAALVAIAGPAIAEESLAKQVERHFAQDETGFDAVVLPEVQNTVVMSSAGSDVAESARRILASGDGWTNRYVEGTGTRFSVDAASQTARSVIAHFAADEDGLSQN